MNLTLIEQDIGNRQIAFNPSAVALRDGALALTALVGRVSTAEENETVVSAVAEMRRIDKLFEQARVDAKKPALDECRLIDEKAREFIAPLMAEITRVGKLLGDWATLQEAKRRDEEAARRRDLEELERQKRAEMAAAKTHEEREAVQDRFESFAASVPVPAPVELPKGQSAKPVWEYQVEDIHALYRAFPHAVKLEVKVGELKALLMRHEGKVPGVKAWETMKVNVRPQRPAKVLEIGGAA